MASKKKVRDRILQDLLDQLERNCTVGEYYVDLVKDYMSLWDVKNQLIEDIKERGVSVKYQNGANQWGYKKNDSVQELVRVNQQMLKILQHLGLKPVAGDGMSDDEEM